MPPSLWKGLLLLVLPLVVVGCTSGGGLSDVERREIDTVLERFLEGARTGDDSLMADALAAQVLWAYPVAIWDLFRERPSWISWSKPSMNESQGKAFRLPLLPALFCRSISSAGGPAAAGQKAGWKALSWSRRPRCQSRSV